MIEAMRVLVNDVDVALPSWQGLGYAVQDRWGPPFAILTGPGPDVWLSGPDTSAAKIAESLGAGQRARAATRPVETTEDFEGRIDELQAAGWKLITATRSGPGGSQVLLEHGETILEVFRPG